MKGNLFDLVFKDDAMNLDNNGYVNILVFGTSEDQTELGRDKVHGYDEVANRYTDSIFVLSVNKVTKQTFFISIPRQTFISDSPHCVYEVVVRLKVIYACYSSASLPGQTNRTGAEKLRDEVAKITGLNIPYYLKIDWTVISDLTDLVGGVDIKPFHDDLRGIYDEAVGLDWHDDGNSMHLNGEWARNLIRARNSMDGSYGLSGGESDRAKNQYLILTELIGKLKNCDEFKNPFTAAGFVNNLGEHVMSNFEASEIRDLMRIFRNMSEMQSLNLADEQLKLFNETTGEDQVHTFYPVAGEDNYSDIQQFIHSKLLGETLDKTISE